MSIVPDGSFKFSMLYLNSLSSKGNEYVVVHLIVCLLFLVLGALLENRYFGTLLG